MQIWVQRLAGRRWELEVPEAVEVSELHVVDVSRRKSVRLPLPECVWRRFGACSRRGLLRWEGSLKFLMS